MAPQRHQVSGRAFWQGASPKIVVIQSWWHWQWLWCDVDDGDGDDDDIDDDDDDDDDDDPQAVLKAGVVASGKHLMEDAKLHHILKYQT